MHGDHENVLKRGAWLVLLLAAGIGASIAFACATPFAALVALAALHLRRSDAVALVGFTWVANQAVGFWLLDYPRTGASFGWGLVVGGAAFVALAAAMGVARAASRRSRAVGAAAVLATAGVVNQATLDVATAVLSSSADVPSRADFVQMVLANVLAFVGLWVIQQAGVTLRLVPARRLLPGAARGS